jgi:hypothetical protein
MTVTLLLRHSGPRFRGDKLQPESNIWHLYILQTPFKSCHSDEKFSGENFITESLSSKKSVGFLRQY